MPVFAIIAQPGPNAENLPAAIAKEFPVAHYSLGGSTWLVAGLGTAQEISDKLGISEGTNGSGIVLQISGYYGRANPNIWAWIKAKWESTANG